MEHTNHPFRKENDLNQTPMRTHRFLPLRFQNSLGDRWGVRGSIGLGILAVAVQVVVFRVILVENLPPKVKQSIDEPYEPRKPWRGVLIHGNLRVPPPCSSPFFWGNDTSPRPGLVSALGW